MMGKKQVYEDDDGRTIADMSGVSRPNLLFPHLPPRESGPKVLPQPEPPAEERPWEEHEFTPEERRWYILGAIKAGLLIALAFGVGLGLIVLLFYLIA